MDGNVTALRKTAPSDESTVKTALWGLRGDLIREAGMEPSELDIAKAAIRLCVKVDRAAASVGPGGHKNSMPAYTYTAEERKEAEKQLMIDLTAGDLIEKAEPVNAREVSAAEAIEHVFRSRRAVSAT
jgi:hypothetical protein